MAWTTPRTWVAGETITAAIMNTHLRDNLFAMGGQVWATFTPTWTSSGTQPTLGNGTLNGRYAECGKTILMWLEWSPGSTSTFGTGAYRWAFPKTSISYTLPSALGGSAYGEDLALTGYLLLPRYVSSTTFEWVYGHTTNNGQVGNNVQATLPFTWGSGDYIRGYIFYEAA